jgi:hypothetical protein
LDVQALAKVVSCETIQASVFRKDLIAPYGAGKRLDGVMLGLVACGGRDTPEEVRPMNAVSMWVLPLPVTVGRLT